MRESEKNDSAEENYFAVSDHRSSQLKYSVLRKTRVEHAAAFTDQTEYCVLSTEYYALSTIFSQLEIRHNFNPRDHRQCH